MNVPWRRGVAVATLAYAAFVLTRPFNQLLMFDPATVNPPGGAGQFVAGIRIIYYFLVPGLYGLAGILVLVGLRLARSLFSFTLVLELIVCFGYLYIASEIDMLGAETTSRVAMMGAYFLVPVTLLILVMMATREEKRRTGR